MGIRTRLEQLVENDDLVTRIRGGVSFEGGENIYNPLGLSLKDGEYSAFNQGYGIDGLKEPLVRPGKVLNTGIGDSFVRGGIATAVQRRAEDALRIGKFLISPKGLNFIAKQVGLQLSNPRINKPHKGVLDLFPPENQRTYNGGVNTLLSVGLGSTTSGLYKKREGGVVPHQGYVDSIGNQESGTGISGIKEGDNRLLKLREETIATAGQNQLKKWTENKTNPLYDYVGGPDSIFGIGKTTIRRYNITNPDGLLTVPRDRKEEISSKSVINFLNDGTDGRLGLGSNYSTAATGSGKSYHRENRIGLGNPGVGANPYKGGRWDRDDKHIRQKNEDGSLRYDVYDAGRVDMINAMDIVRIKDGDHQKSAFRDLVRFRFEAIEADSENFSESDTMVFRAFLESFDDNYNASHNEFKYNGRGEHFYTYNSFKRNLNVSFKVAAQTRWEMMPIYRKLNFLVSNTAPEYSSYGRIRTPMIRMTVGSWCNRIPGVLSSVSLKWQKDYPWEINLDGPEIGGKGGGPHMLVLPHVRS